MCIRDRSKKHTLFIFFAVTLSLDILFNTTSSEKNFTYGSVSYTHLDVYKRQLSDKEPASTNELESAADSLIAAITISAPWIELTPPMAIPATVIPFKILSTFFLFI